MTLAMTERSPKYKYGPGKHPNSIASLTGREQIYDEPKKGRQISLTQTAWLNLKDMAESKGLSVSELIERFARNTLF